MLLANIVRVSMRHARPHPHHSQEAVPLCGSFEVRFPDGRPSRYFYWDDIPGRRLRPDLVDSAVAKREAQRLVRIDQNDLDCFARWRVEGCVNIGRAFFCY